MEDLLEKKARLKKELKELELKAEVHKLNEKVKEKELRYKNRHQRKFLQSFAIVGLFFVFMVYLLSWLILKIQWDLETRVVDAPKVYICVLNAKGEMLEVSRCNGNPNNVVPKTYEEMKKFYK